LLILLIDPRPLARECIAGWLQTCHRAFRILAAAEAGDVKSGRYQRHELDLAILSTGALRITDSWVVDSLQRLEQVMPGRPVVVLADLVAAQNVVDALRMGVRGYITMNLTTDVVVQALELVRVGGIFIPPEVLTNGVARRVFAQEDSVRAFVGVLTPRQFEVLGALRTGKSNKAIAYELGIDESTVKLHVRHILHKLNASNRTEAALIAQSLLNQSS